MATLWELWKESVEGSEWDDPTLKVEEQLNHIETLAVRPRIPDDHLIFRIFRVMPNPRTELKVLLVGQDPYPSMITVEDEEENDIRITQACGFSFSSPIGAIPVSLRNIYSEILREEYPDPKTRPKPSSYSGDLSYLIAQGVFLLNTCLTVDVDRQTLKGIPDSHGSWNTFTIRILKFINRICPNVICIAFGKRSEELYKGAGIKDYIYTDHPAARFMSKVPLRGSSIFSNINKLLEDLGKEKISWEPMKESVDTEYYKS